MENSQISIVIAEPSAIIAAGFSSVLSGYNAFKIVEHISDLRFLPGVVSRYFPDILVVNPVLFDYRSKSSVRSMVSGEEGMAIAALTSTLYNEAVFSQFDAVISVYDSPSAIVKSLRKAYKTAKGVKPHEGQEYDLSEREKEILDLYIAGKTVKEIVALTGLKESTIRFHNRNIYTKLNVHSLKQLLRYAAIMKQEEGERGKTNGIS